MSSFPGQRRLNVNLDGSEPRISSQLVEHLEEKGIHPLVGDMTVVRCYPTKISTMISAVRAPIWHYFSFLSAIMMVPCAQLIQLAKVRNFRVLFLNR